MSEAFWSAIDFLLGYLLVAAAAVGFGWVVATMIKETWLHSSFGSAISNTLRLGGLS